MFARGFGPGIVAQSLFRLPETQINCTKHAVLVGRYRGESRRSQDCRPGLGITAVRAQRGAPGRVRVRIQAEHEHEAGGESTRVGHGPESLRGLLPLFNR